MHFFLLLLFVLFFISCSIGAKTTISSVDEFIEFKNNVNSGTTYVGMTVFLDSDMSFSGKTFEPIGYSGSSYFRGVFDGQGYVISNLAINSSSLHAGLFEYSRGLAIKNVILDSSCSITNSYSGPYDARAGGFLGYCNASSEPCTIENSVNMGSVSFTGI